jgi:hypothetical protein
MKSEDDNMSDFTHFNEQGRAKMVDVGEKPISQRTAVAAARVLVNEHTFSLIRSGGMKKGDVLTVDAEFDASEQLSREFRHLVDLQRFPLVSADCGFLVILYPES